ncbi:MAG TPA: hypothetical protein PKW97_05355 [Syntrophorhabdus sp.]|jgi:hypothetical protein|nr:MAG: hypothetical protein A4E59_00882 [Syntrophorhabdus sp. PtaB.Bin027]HQI97822.1 hypothetical protein [Syntrophorhabdus sp.]HQM25925.1 hypothetical protein [Syntrophorhabdus sp.]
MTKLLEKAFKEASKLPKLEQNAFAKWVMDELKTEAKLQEAFASPEDILDKLADEALAEHKAGKSKILNVGNQ